MGFLRRLKRECAAYVATVFSPAPLARNAEGFRNENLEEQTFSDESFDLVVTLDVMEHVNHPDLVFQDVARTLKPGGAYLFTVPTQAANWFHERRALRRTIYRNICDAQVDGNPVSDAGSLVTFHYGYDLAELIYQVDDVEDSTSTTTHGIIGDFTEVYRATPEKLSEV